MCYNPMLIYDKLLGVPASVKLVYWIWNTGINAYSDWKQITGDNDDRSSADDSDDDNQQVWQQLWWKWAYGD